MSSEHVGIAPEEVYGAPAGAELAGGGGILVTDHLILDSRPGVHTRLARLLVRIVPPAVIFVVVLALWEIIVPRLGVQDYELPRPSHIWLAFMSVHDTVLTYGWFTFWDEAFRGFLIGSAIGFLLAVMALRFRVLARAVIPYAVISNSIPIVAIAPIAVVLFGFGWQSKVFVCSVMTVFPMMINAYRGLTVVDQHSHQLMRSYAAGEWTTFWKLRLPGALPYIFNGLKINTTLAMIGAIVAEYFGSPPEGLGLYINNQAGINAYPEVWAAVMVACVFGVAFYGAVLLLERRFTAWHVSYRSGR